MGTNTSVMESYIELKEIKLYAYHGVDKQERTVGNNYKIRVKVKYNIEKAGKSDSINDTLNYADLFDVIKCEMGIASNLLEHVAVRIVEAIKRNFKEVEGGELEIEKVKPPISGDVTGASVIIKW